MIEWHKIYRKLYVTIHLNNLIFFGGIIFFFQISALNVQAQEGVQQRFFTSQNGLKISWVNSITKSQNNTITIVHSPMFSFARYDGVNFDYTISPSGILGKTYEDFSGNLWSIDERNIENVNFYSNDKWQNLEFDAGIPFMPTPGMGNKLLFIRDGALKEFDKVKQQTRIIKQAEESQIGQLIDMTTFQDGSVWIAGENGVAKYLAQCDTCDSEEQWIDFQVPKELGLYHFNKPFEGENGELTFMSKSSKKKQNILVGFDGKMWKKLYASQTDEVYYGWRGLDNTLWIIKGSTPPLNGSLRDWNLFHVQQGQETLVEKNRILNRVLNDIIVEPNGSFWLATGSGLAYFTPSLWRKQTAKVDLNKRIKKIHEDLSGRLWFAMEDAFSLFSDDKWEMYQNDENVFTGDICSLKNGLLVVGTTDSGGLALYNPIDKSYAITFPFGNEKVRYYDQDKNGNCFIILQNSNETSRLIRYDGERIEILAEDLKINDLAPGECEVTDIIQTSSGDIWIVTYTDIIVYKKGIRKSFDLKEEFEWGLSTSVLELGNGNIWISGGKGILQYDGKNWSLVQSPEFETARMMIISKDSSIWVASGTGVHRLINGIWISNTNEDGLPNAVIFNLLEDKQGKIWAASENGIFCYFPEADTDAPETVVPSDMNSHEAVPSGEIQFMFEGHDKWDYTQDDRLQYSYRFDENSWSPFGNKTIAKGVGLSAGSHVFEVRAIDRNGNIDQSPARWHFTVLLPWYLETYVIILLVIAISLIILAIWFTITGRRQVEKLVILRTAELNRSKENVVKNEAKLQSILITAMDGYWVTDNRGNFIEVNDAYCKMSGYSKKQLLTMSIADVEYIESSKDILERLESVKKKKGVRFESKHKCKDGSIIDVEVSVQYYKSDEEQFVCFIKEITEQKHAEHVKKVLYNISNAVIKSNDLNELLGLVQIELGTIIDTTNFYIALYDSATHSFSVPYSADKKDDIVSFPASKTVTNYVIKTQQPLLANKAKVKRMIQAGDLKMAGTPSEIWLGVPLKSNEKTIGVLAVQSYTDENAYDESDMTILNFVSDQIAIVIERKKVEQDLLKALENATESDRLKSAFLATMSHELRTPLNAIIGFSDIIDDTLPISDIIKFNKTINKSGTHLLSIVEDLFDLTLIETGVVNLKKEDKNIYSLLQEVHQVIKVEQQNIKKAHLDLFLRIPPKSKNLVIRTDHSKLKQILLNLLKNALKFTNTGSVNYGFKIDDLEGKRRLQFYVEDTGIGIHKDNLEFIFERFRQVDETDTKTFGGAGIGLSISKKMVELLGGEIWVESTEKKGSAFYFTIPYTETENIISTDQLKTNSIKGRSKELENKTILVVEDDETSYELLKVIINGFGINTIKWAKNGEEAVKLCKENPAIDLVLMDINMPVMDGYQATKSIKAFKPDLPIIAQTAFAILGDREKSLEAGCDDYITKPIKKEELLEKMEKFLK